MPGTDRYPNRQSPPISRLDGLAAIGRFLTRPKEERSQAVLTTVDPDRRPHACWMAVILDAAFDTLFAITSPDSRKVNNILQNPQVEWMLTSADLRELVYARGDVEIVLEPSQVFECWTQLPANSRPYFLRVHREGMAFMLLKTAIREFEYCVPNENVFITFSPAEVRQHFQDPDTAGASGSE